MARPRSLSSRQVKQRAAAELRARILPTLAGMPTVAPLTSELAKALGVTEAELAPHLVGLQARGRHVETWPEPGGGTRIMLAAHTARRLGLRLDRKGERWVGPWRG